MTAMQQFFARIQKLLKEERKIQPFSWQTALLLSLFAWCVFLLIREPLFKHIVSFFGWGFLILGLDWAFLTQPPTKIPLLHLQIKFGPWITGAVLTLALFSNRLIVQDLPSALVSWPLLSALLATFPKFLKPGPQFKPFKEINAFNRQELVLIYLYALLFSCWFQFQFFIMGALVQYPSLQADSFERSAFVVKLNSFNSPATKGTDILTTAESLVRDRMNDRSWNDAQRWLQTISSEVPALGAEIADRVFGQQPRVREGEFWRFNALYQPGVTSGTLDLQAIWQGPSSRETGYTLDRACLVREAPVRIIRGLEKPLDLFTPYQMDCQPIQSSLAGVQVEPVKVTLPTGNLDQWWSRWVKRTVPQMPQMPQMPQLPQRTP